MTNKGCPEYAELTRRQVIGGATAATVAATLGVSWLPQVAFGQAGPVRDVVLSVYLRGGMDGLSMCVPFGDPEYYVLRDRLAIPPPDASNGVKALNLDGYFGLHPSLSPLMNAYNAGHLLFVHAVGAPNWSRSHFDAQRWMEVGKAGDNTTMTGWLGRHLATVAPMKATAPLRGISMTYGMVRTLGGAPKTLPMDDPDRFGFGGGYQNEEELSLWVGRAYNRAADGTTAAVTNTRATISMLDRINFSGYVPRGGAVYPNSSFGYAMKSSAALIKANAGVEAIHVDMDGFDTHSDQGTLSGHYNNLMTDMGNTLGAFYKDMAASSNLRWTLVVMSEFGRTARENGAEGTDHGTGSCMMVLGGGVIGKRVLRRWPGLQRHQLYQNVDLAVTIDYRDILAEIVKERLGNANLAAVFPGFTPTIRNVVRAA